MLYRLPISGQYITLETVTSVTAYPENQLSDKIVKARVNVLHGANGHETIFCEHYARAVELRDEIAKAVNEAQAQPRAIDFSSPRALVAPFHPEATSDGSIPDNVAYAEASLAKAMVALNRDHALGAGILLLYASKHFVDPNARKSALAAVRESFHTLGIDVSELQVDQ